MTSPYLEVSPNVIDGGNLIGVAPDRILLDDLLALGHPTSPLKAIRANCLGCAYFSEAEVRKCLVTRCPLWPFRMGKNVFHAQGKHARAQQESSNTVDELNIALKK